VGENSQQGQNPIRFVGRLDMGAFDGDDHDFDSFRHKDPCRYDARFLFKLGRLFRGWNLFWYFPMVPNGKILRELLAAEATENPGDKFQRQTLTFNPALFANSACR
jgi:hypothetical protein